MDAIKGTLEVCVGSMMQAMNRISSSLPLQTNFGIKARGVDQSDAFSTEVFADWSHYTRIRSRRIPNICHLFGPKEPPQPDSTSISAGV
jgi:hypothetical protein